MQCMPHVSASCDRHLTLNQIDNWRLRPILTGNLERMNTNTQSKPWLRLCTGALVGGGLALSALGLASGTAQAAPPPAPVNHWCPGDPWNPGWGPNPYWNQCRDWEGNYGGPAGYGAPPWAPPPPPPPIWAPGAQVVWNPQANGWGFWNGAIWVPL
jgi:hypothetical protein